MPSSITRSFIAITIGGTNVVGQTDCRTGAFNSGKLRTMEAGQKTSLGSKVEMIG